MRSAFQRTNLLVFSFGVVFGVSIAFAGKPLYQSALKALSRDRFFVLTEACDEAMRLHLIAKNQLDLSPSEATVRHLRSAELALLVCQDYDLMRKRLIAFGLDDNALSEMTLDFAEARGRDLRLVVETHELRY